MCRSLRKRRVFDFVPSYLNFRLCASERIKKKGDHRPRNSAQYERVVELLIMHKAKTDTETNFVVTIGFTTKVDHQTTLKICASQIYRKCKPEGSVNSLFCPAHGCTNSRFIKAELQNPRTREHVFLGSVTLGARTPRSDDRDVDS